MTSDAKELFLIYDNKDQTVNRIIGFCSPLGLRMLSESNFHHSDGTFHTKAKYFGQLYVFHAWFPYLKYDKNEEKVWQKRMIPCAWFYMKRRRTKDYIQILDALVTSAKMLNFVIKTTHAMIDFEKATEK